MPLDCGPPLSAEARSRVLTLVSRSRSQSSWLASVAAAVALSPDAETLRTTIERLAARADSDPNPEVWIAIGALEEALARTTGDSSLLVDAFEHNERALSADRASEPALFNRAVIAADLGLCREARGAWRDFLERDRSSPWAAEARERSALLACSVRSDNRHRVDRLFLEAFEELLPAWLEARGSPAAEIALAEMSRRGEELAEIGGDTSVRELVREIGGLRDPAHAAAFAAYAAGRVAFDARRQAGARTKLEQARPVLGRFGSVLTPWCDVWLAGTEIYDGRYEEAQHRLAPHLETLELASSPRLAGRIFWTSGLAFLRDGRLEAAHDRFADAERAFHDGGYTAAVAAIRILKATTLGNLGFPRQSWWDRAQGMRALQGPRPHFMLHNGLLDGATVAQRTGDHELASALLREAAAAARDNGDPISQTEALLWHARALRQRGAHERATDAFEAALEATRSISQRYVRDRFAGIARLGLWADPGRLQVADAELEAAVRFHAGASRTLHLKALRVKAEVERRRGDGEAARVTLSGALRVIREQQRSLGAERFQLSYLESRQEVFDDAAALALSQGLILEALRLLEASRQLEPEALPAAALLPGLRTATADDAGRVEADEPVVVVFGVVQDRFAWWRVDGDRVTSRASDVSELARLAGSVIDGAPQGRISRGDAEALYGILLAEPLRGVARERPLILVPDGYLQQIPYAALTNPTTGSYLVEERAISFRTDLQRALQAGLDGAGTTERGSWRILAVGDPAFDGTQLPWLPRLRGALQEARRVADLYRHQAVLLVDEAATIENVRGELASSQILHLAGHATAGSDPSRDAVVLARDPQSRSSGLAVVSDLLGSTSTLRLVVLSACSTLGQRPSRSGGLLGLAREFVSRGVSATLGTLWPVADGQQEELMVAFHRGLRRGLSASEALRRAQLEFLRNGPPESCCDWAAAQLIGDLALEYTPSSPEP